MTLLANPTTKPLTVDEFLAHPDADGHELINGVIAEKKPMGALSSYVASQVIFFLNLFNRQARVGHVFESDVIYRCFGNATTGRKGDASFIRRRRLPGDRIPDGAIDIPADLVVEVVSPTDLAYDVEAKAKLYLDHGFGELWVVFPNARTVHVRRVGAPSCVLTEADVITGSGALAGFRCEVRELFPS